MSDSRDVEHQRTNAEAGRDDAFDDKYVAFHKEIVTSSLDTADIDTTDHSSFGLQHHDDIPAWRKHTHLILMAFHGFFVTSNASGFVPAVGIWAEQYHVSINTAVYIATCQLLSIAIGPLIWTPLGNKYGRVPILMLSALGSSMFNIACSEAESYASHFVYRFIGGLFISAGTNVVQGVIAEMFDPKQRAQKMGIWVLGTNVGTALGPCLFGIVIETQGYRWAYRIFAILEFALFALYYAFSPETLQLSIRHDISDHPPTKKWYHWVLRWLLRIQYPPINATPLQVLDFVRPLFLLRHWKILLVTIAYSVAHNYVFTLLVVQLSTLYVPMFHLNPRQTGLNYLSLLVGIVLGEPIAGPVSDYFLNRKSKREPRAKSKTIEDRLWFTHIGSLAVIAGVVIFFVELANAKDGHWNIKPDIGVAVASFGVQLVATASYTYCSDSCPPQESASLGTCINMVKLIWAFVSPFWYPAMVQSCGLKGSAGVVAGTTIAGTMLPLAALQLWARLQRAKE